MIEIEMTFSPSQRHFIGRLFEGLPAELRPNEYRLDEDKPGPNIRSPGDIEKLFNKQKDGFLLYGHKIEYMLRFGTLLPIRCNVDLDLDPELAFNFFLRMAAARPLFAYAGQPTERNARNRIVHDLDCGSLESWVGRDLQKYVPGLYWLTLLPAELIAKHGIPIETLVEAAIEHCVLDGGQHLFRFYERPEDWRTTGKIDELIAASEGFFNIENARQALVGIKKFLPANEALRAWN